MAGGEGMRSRLRRTKKNSSGDLADRLFIAPLGPSLSQPVAVGLATIYNLVDSRITISQ